MNKVIKDFSLSKNILLSNTNMDATHIKHRRIILINLTFILSTTVYITFFIIHFFFQHKHTEGLIELSFALPSLIGFFKLRLDHKINAAAFFATCIIFATTLIVIYLFKFQDGILFWALLFPLIAMNLCGVKRGLFFALIFNLAVYIGGYFYCSYEIITYITYFRYVAVSIIVSTLVFFYEKSISKSFEIQNNLNKTLIKRVNETKKLAITDSLTKLFNRRHFDTVIDEEFNRAKRANKSFTLAIIDVDNFKPYNDTYGHDKGDEILIKLGQILNQQTSRSGDYAFRIGGEEFAIILQSESYEDIYTHFEQLRILIELEKITHEANKPFKYLTISIGVTVTNDCHKISIKEVYTIADENLYHIKKNGRNGTMLTISDSQKNILIRSTM